MQQELQALLHKEDVHHDIYAIGTQGGVVSSMFKPSKATLNRMIADELGENFVML